MTLRKLLGQLLAQQQPGIEQQLIEDFQVPEGACSELPRQTVIATGIGH